MKKLLLSFVYCFLAVGVFGQQATWNASAANTKSWVYSFAGGLNSGIGSSFAPVGNAGADLTPPIPLSYISTSSDRQFLPSPTSGEISVRAGNSGRPVFTIDGTTDALKFAASPNTNIGKFAIIAVDGATAITSMNLTVKFSATDAEWILALGKTTAGGIFTSTSNLTAAATTGREAIFTSFRWKADGNIEAGQHTASANPTFSTIGTYSVNTDYKLEFLCNNTIVDQHYTKNEIQHTIPSKKLHFWINNVQVELSTGVYDFLSSGGLATDDAINSLMLQGRTTGAVATISGLNIQSAASATVLPVSLTSFTGKAVNNSVLLNWQTASESNNSHFDVLRFSAENNNPVKIGEIAGKGNSSALVNYSFSDKQPLTGVNYYQLRQVDNDGKSALSEIVPVKVGLNDAQFYVYPANSGNYNASFYSESTTTGTFTLLDVNGRILNDQKLPLQKGNNIISLNNQSLIPGIYLSRAVANGEEIIRKFIVK